MDILLLPISIGMEEISFILTENSRLLAAAAATMVFAGLLVMRYQRRRIREQLPPGPPLEPFVGTLRFMPSSHQWLTFADWSKKWGESPESLMTVFKL